MVKEIETNEEFYELVYPSDPSVMSTEPKHILVDFYADWCGPCKRIAPELEKLSKSYPDVTFIKVNVDTLQELSQKYAVASLPTFMVFKQGNLTPLKSTVGANIQNINTMLKSLTPINVKYDF